MAVNEDVSAYSNAAASNTPAGGDTVGPDLDNHLRDMKKNIRQVAENFITVGDENFKGRIKTSTSGSTHTLKYFADSGDMSLFQVDDSASSVTVFIDDVAMGAAAKSFNKQTSTASARNSLINSFLQGVDLTGTAASHAKMGVGTAAGDLVELISGSATAVALPVTSGENLTNITIPLPRSYGAGCILSNDTDAAHDINVTAGAWRNAANGGDLILASEMTKQIDATWSAGDDAGGLSSSLTAPANDTWYHVFLILVSGSVDVGFDTSLTAANLIADHSATEYRLIGSRLTDGSANLIPMVQNGDHQFYDVLQSDLTNGTVNQAETLVTLSTPLGRRLPAIINASQGTFGRPILFYSPDTTGAAPSSTSVPVPTIGNSASNDTPSQAIVLTNASSQIAGRAAVGNNTDASISTIGWIDDRGRNG